jgi:glycosyltransferase involved in cell wall biosynthesis
MNSHELQLKKLRIAIVCDWLTVQGGAEKVILGLHQLFPNAPIYTSLYNPEKVKGFENAEIHTSYIQKIPGAKNHHQFFLYLMPRAFENFDLSKYDIVISSSHSCAKGIIVSPGTLHVSYCHSPMRYAWENHQNYIKEYAIAGIIKKIAPFLIHKIRLWDRLSADRVDQFIANSGYIKKRIKKFYRRDSAVIHPFIDIRNFHPGTQSDFYLAVGRLTSYKKFDLIVDAFNRLGLPLKIVGSGNMEKRLKAIAKPNIEFLGFVADDQLRQLYGKAKGLIFPQCEDFGIIPLEAMASGCPIIAYRKGGALETIIDEQTGIFFPEQTVDSLIDAVKSFEKLSFDRQKIIAHTTQFDQQHFNKNFLEFIGNAWSNYSLKNI